MIKIDSFIVNKDTNSSSSNGGGGFANAVTVQKKLEKHKLWGQEFDGTQDVDGDMTINGNVAISGNVTATNGNITNVNSTTINNSGNIVNGGNITNNGNLKTTDATVNNDLTVTNNANVNNDLTVGNNATVTNDLTVGNSATIGTINSTTGNITNIKSNNITNADTIKTKNLQVTGTAHFFNLIIDKIKAAGGAALFTPADGFDVDIVQDSQNEVKLLWQCQDEDGNQRDNMWKVNDQALCMSFNKAKVGTTHNVSNKYYWALVTGTNPVDEPLVVDGVKYNYITLSKTVVDGVLNPEFGDSIVMCGYRGTDDAARQSAIYISAYSSLDKGLTAPLLAQYQGINNFNLESHRTSYYDAVGAKFVGDFEVEGKNVTDYIKDKVDDKYSSLSVTVDGINTKVVNNTNKITNLGNKLDIANNNITALETTVSNNYSTLDQKADGIKATVSANTETITAQGTSISNLESGLTSTNSTITALTKTVKDNYSTLDQKADNISSTVSSHTQIIEGLDGRVTTNTENISKVKQTASSITSTVSSMKNDLLGANCMLGLNGKGWSSNTIYEDAGNSFHCESTDWFQSHPIMDFSGDYTFSFVLWNDNLQIKILDFTQTYYDAGIYDPYVDFGTYTPCKILTTPATLPNTALTNYANNGTASNWTYTNTEAITLKVNDNVAVRVKNGDNNRYNSIYGKITAINTSSKSVTVQAIALLDQPNTICILTCPKDKKDGTAINSLHYDEKLGRYWIRFKETRGTAKTFVMLFRNLTSTIGWISRLMLEESVEYPHKYNNTGQASQSMIKQTANEILMSVNDTYLKIGDGNITLNGDTKVNGSLTLNDKKQGFLLVGNGGTTEISPNSIGTYNEFASKTTNVIKTNYDSKIYGYKAEDGDYYRFSFTVLQRLGTFKKGTYIKILNYTNYAYAVGATSHISTPYGKFYIYEDGTTTKTIDIGNDTSVDIANYTVVGDNVDVIVDGHFTIGVPTSIWGYIDPHYKPAIGVSVNWNNEVPKASSTFMLIGYDGWGISFGTNKTVYSGKDGFVAKYGDNEFRITDTGISHNNMATTYTIIGTSSSSSPTTYTVQDPVDTVLCKSGYCKVIFPEKPYNGQRIKIYDKSPQESYINSNGKYVCGADRRYSDRRIWTNQNLPNMAVRIYTYINDTWFEEYTG